MTIDYILIIGNTRVTLVKQELFTLPEQLGSSPRMLDGVRVALI